MSFKYNNTRVVHLYCTKKQMAGKLNIGAESHLQMQPLDSDRRHLPKKGNKVANCGSNTEFQCVGNPAHDQAMLPHQLGVLSVNSILTLSAWR